MCDEFIECSHGILFADNDDAQNTVAGVLVDFTSSCDFLSVLVSR